MNLLITGAFHPTPAQKAQLESGGYTLYFHADERAAVPQPARYDAVICNGLFLYQDIALFENLKIIQLTSAGLDRVPVDVIHRRGIRLFNAGSAYSVPMAEWAVWGVLSLYKNAAFFQKNKAEKRWEKDRSIRLLARKTALILGYGNTGRQIAKRLAAFDCRIIASDPAAAPDEWCHQLIAPDAADAWLPQADLVILTLPLTKETAHYMDARRLSLLKEDAVLVNLSRGGLVDEDALCACLAQEKLLGCVLDVFEEEPLPVESPLWQYERVLVTPHNSFVGEGNEERLFAVIAKNLLA